MAYFSNGTEGMMYEERYCYRCRNWRDRGDGRGSGCAIWDLHFLYSSQECNQKSNAKDMLDTLIPMVDSGHGFNTAGECSLFLEMPQEEIDARDAEFNRKAAEEAEKAMPVSKRPNRGPAVMPAMLEWAQRRGLIP